jgi:hypothetical protein
VGRHCAHNPNFVWDAILVTVRDDQLYVCRKSRRGELESVISSVSPASFAPKHQLNQRQLRTLGANALSRS